MTDKEQALVAAAYLVAANAICPSEKAKWSKKLQPMADANRAVCEVNRDVILNLSTSEAEAKLRDLMMEVAKKARYSGAPENIKEVVDEVLNEIQ